MIKGILMKICQNCGRRNPAFYKECPNCKESLQDSPEATSHGGGATKRTIAPPSGELSYNPPSIGSIDTSSNNSLPVNMKKEYKRTCLSCNKVWHSLVSREKAIEEQIFADRLHVVGGAAQGCSTCGTIGGSRVTQGEHNIATNESTLSNLRQCPECKSSNYNEAVL